MFTIEFEFYDDFNRNLQYSYKKQLIILHYIIAQKYIFFSTVTF